MFVPVVWGWLMRVGERVVGERFVWVAPVVVGLGLLGAAVAFR